MHTSLNKSTGVHFDKKLFLFLACCFIVFTVIGTLSHELGHYLAARALGYEARIHYAYTQTAGEITARDSLWITGGGILQTLFVGTTGCLILFIYRRRFYTCSCLSFKQWLAIFLSLFWLRELFNFLGGILRYLLTSVVPAENDEIKLAARLDAAPWIFSGPLAFVAFIVLMIVCFRVMPRQQRLTFIASGLVGGSLGFYLWLCVLGPLMLP